REEPKRGASARILAPTADAFAIVLKGRGSPVSSPMLAHAGAVTRFLEEFTRDGTFAGSIVVGSPYTHGPFNPHARDSPSADEQVGLIAKVRNPWNADRVIVLLSGLHAVGTMAAILGLTRFADDVLDGFAPGDDFYRVVAGQDRDGDGRLDAVSILE